eukprot:6151813-Prymnesium_polylepis.1
MPDDDEEDTAVTKPSCVAANETPAAPATDGKHSQADQSGKGGDEANGKQSDKGAGAGAEGKGGGDKGGRAGRK